MHCLHLARDDLHLERRVSSQPPLAIPIGNGALARRKGYPKPALSVGRKSGDDLFLLPYQEGRVSQWLRVDHADPGWPSMSGRDSNFPLQACSRIRLRSRRRQGKAGKQSEMHDSYPSQNMFIETGNNLRRRDAECRHIRRRPSGYKNPKFGRRSRDVWQFRIGGVATTAMIRPK